MFETKIKSNKIEYLFFKYTNENNIEYKFSLNSFEKGCFGLEKAKDFIKNLNPKTIHRIVFTGGEPLIYKKDILKLIKFAKDHGILSILETNATLLTFEDVDLLNKIGLDAMVIELNGLKDTHNNLIKNSSNSYDKIIDLIKKIVKTNITLALKTKAMPQNIHELPKICDLCISLNVFEYIIDRPVGFKHDYDYTLIPKNLLKSIFLELFNRSNNINIRCRDPLYNTIEPMVDKIYNKYKDLSKILAGCSAGISICCIDPKGNLLPCDKSSLIVGNVYEKDFYDLWNNSGLFNKLRNRTLKGICGICPYKFICGGCRASAFEKFKDFFQGEPICSPFR